MTKLSSYNLSNSILFSLILFFVSGCSRYNNKSITKNNSIEMQKISLKQTRPNGDLFWEVLTPNASFDDVEGLVIAIEPNGFIYNNQEKSYNIYSEEMKIINSGEILQLNGNVNIVQLNGQKFSFTGNSLKWNTKEGIINFNGITIFKRWPLNNKLNSKSDLTIKSNDLNWNINTGNFRAKGPINVNKLYDERLVKDFVKAKQLKGNTFRGELTLDNCIVDDVNTFESKAEFCSLYWFVENDSKNHLEAHKYENINNPLKHNRDYLQKLLMRSRNNDVRTVIKNLF